MIGKLLDPYRALQKSIGYRFKKRKALEAALTHRSFRFENDREDEDNQRLEFLGDAVLGFAAAAYLYEKYPDTDEGLLTSLRSQLTSGKDLSRLAKSIDLGKYLRIGKGEEKSGGRKRSSNLEDALESVIGAAYLDGGFKAVKKIFQKLFVPEMENLSGDMWAGNPKGKLQEYSQRKWKKSPTYRIVEREGPAHAVMFTAEVEMNDTVYGRGKGKNKQDAEAQAAKSALRKIKGRRSRKPGD